jgi:hypothetical protein
MKNIIGFIGAYTCFIIGDAACRVCYFKYNSKYIFDCGLLANTYQRMMHYSIQINDWAKINFWKRPPSEPNDKVIATQQAMP